MLGEPRLGVRVGRQGPERRGVGVAADRQQDPYRHRLQRIEHAAIEAGVEGGQRARHRSERDVDQRGVGVLPPMREGLRGGRRGVAEALGGAVVEARRDDAQQRRGALGLAREARLAAQVRDGGGGQLRDPVLGGGEAERDAAVRTPWRSAAIGPANS